MPLSKEEAIKRGIPIKEIQHSMKRRALWNDYFMPGRYGVTVHLLSDEDGNIIPKERFCNIVGSCRQNNVGIELTDLGRLIKAKIDGIGSHKHEEDVKVIHSCIMPTHIHLTIEIFKMLPLFTKRGKQIRYTLGNIVDGIKTGSTSQYHRLLMGESVDHILQYPNWRDIHNEDGTLKEGVSSNSHLLTSEGNIEHASASIGLTQSLWEKGYNDKILNTTRKTEEWILYEDLNAYFWQLENENPKLMQRRLHIDVKMRNDGKVVDFSAFGCLFLLRKGERIQVQCTRLAEKGMLNPQEWAFFSQPEQVRKYEAERKINSLGGYDYRWLYTRDPAAKTPIPYELTEHFRKYKDGILAQVKLGAIPISPAVSKGEQEIFYAAADDGYPVIKLSKQIFTPRKHPVRKDRLLCAAGVMLVLGPWNMPRGDHYTRRGEKISEDSDRAIFKDLNRLAERMCDQIGSLNLKEQLEEMDLSDEKD